MWTVDFPGPLLLDVGEVLVFRCIRQCSDESIPWLSLCPVCHGLQLGWHVGGSLGIAKELSKLAVLYFLHPNTWLILSDFKVCLSDMYKWWLVITCIFLFADVWTYFQIFIGHWVSKPYRKKATLTFGVCWWQPPAHTWAWWRQQSGQGQPGLHKPAAPCPAGCHRPW